MGDWKTINIQGIAFIEKCVAEFNVGELVKTPYSKFKVKIFEKKDGTFVGFTNLQLKDEDNIPYAGVGHGETIEAALEDTIKYFLNMINNKRDLSNDDFECVDSYDF